VLEGEFEIMCGGEVYTATAGTIAFLPRGVPHTFRNVGATIGRLLGTASPGGHETFFRDIHDLGPAALETPEKVMQVCAEHGIEILAPPQ
jgi:uncharacterized cupin superfamily protein